ILGYSKPPPFNYGVIVNSEEVGTLGYSKPSSDEEGGPLAVEGGKKCSLLLFLSLDYGAVLSADLNFVI
ncbi:MAG: hypothetical protein MSH11_01580, partial [Ruminococcus sp.]|nr:hypothetical protein [Ruminococcus sp.]